MTDITAPDNTPSESRPAVLRLENLRFRYPVVAEHGDSHWTVDIGAFEMRAGEQVLLTGSSGQGKSTLLQLIAGLLEPNEGTIHVGGENLNRLHGGARDHFRGKHIGMIFQTFNLLHGFTALENVMAALMFTDIPGQKHESMSKGMLEHLDVRAWNRPIDTLSVGQQQRVAVARAVVASPDLVLADEPTASLDPTNTMRAMDLIQGICREQDIALLCTSHDPDIVDRFPRHHTLQELIRIPVDHQA